MIANQAHILASYRKTVASNPWKTEPAEQLPLASIHASTRTGTYTITYMSMYTYVYTKTHMGKFKLINIERFPVIRKSIIPNSNKNFYEHKIMKKFYEHKKTNMAKTVSC